jgi:hypothetical protein
VKPPAPPFSLLYGPQTWQTFKDDEAADVRPQVLHGTWGELHAELMAANDAGAGIYYTVNETDGLGRKATNVREIRAWYTDIDGVRAPLAKRGVVRRLLEHATPPSAVIETRNGIHALWYAVPGHDLDLEAYRATEEGVIGYWGGDQSVKDIARVLRAPGFVHRKRKVDQPLPEPFLIRVLFESPECFYTEGEIRKAFPPPVREYRADHDRTKRVASGDDDWSKVVGGIAAWNPVPMARHRVVTLACGVAIKFSVSESRCVADLLPIVGRWDTGRDMDAELKRTARWAYQRGDAATVKALRQEGVPIPPLSRPAD